MALAQAHYRQGNFQEAADLYARLMQDSPPTLVLLRGLGLSLARLKRYDQAYKHLRTALELDGGRDAFIAGYLALCGAMGKPTNADDRPKNVAWAIRLLARYQQTGNAEWAGICNAVFAEARALRMPLTREDQVHLCQTLASVHSADPVAASAFAHVAATHPDALTPHFAWLYAHAASAHGVQSDDDLAIFALAFQNPVQMKAYFGVQKWIFEDAEYAYLRPPRLSRRDGFPKRWVRITRRAARNSSRNGRHKRKRPGTRTPPWRAWMSCSAWLRSCLAVYDRLACLHYRRGDRDQALKLLNGWHNLEPANKWPLIRAAVIEQERGNGAQRAAAIDRALGLTQGKEKAAVAFLGARLELRSLQSPGDAVRVPSSGFQAAVDLLEQCLSHDPQHTEAMWCLAAIRSVTGDRDQLAALAPRLDRPDVKDARFHFLGAVSHLAARDYGKAVELGRLAAADEKLSADSQFVVAWALLRQKNAAEARLTLQRVAGVDKAPSAVYARALLGQMSFVRGAYDDAVKWWNAIDAQRRAEWKIDETLRNTVLLSGLLAFDQKRIEQAADRFREAGRLGLRDRRFGDLLTAALVKAGQRLLFDATK